MNSSITYFISLKHATAIIKKMHQKKHRDAGYFFELEELAPRLQFNANAMPQTYAKYADGTVLYMLKIYYEKPNHETPPVKKGKPHRSSRK